MKRRVASASATVKTKALRMPLANQARPFESQAGKPADFREKSGLAAAREILTTI